MFSLILNVFLLLKSLLFNTGGFYHPSGIVSTGVAPHAPLPAVTYRQFPRAPLVSSLSLSSSSSPGAREQDMF